LADRAFELQEPSSAVWSEKSKPSLIARLDQLEKQVKKELANQGFEGNRVRVERMLNMRFDGTDTALMAVAELESEDFEGAFKKMYKAEFGFLLETKTIVIDDVKVSRLGKGLNGPNLNVSFNRSVELGRRLIR